jgi:hypothetical protein
MLFQPFLESVPLELENALLPFEFSFQKLQSGVRHL